MSAIIIKNITDDNDCAKGRERERREYVFPSYIPCIPLNKSEVINMLNGTLYIPRSTARDMDLYVVGTVSLAKDPNSTLTILNGVPGEDCKMSGQLGF